MPFLAAMPELTEMISAAASAGASAGASAQPPQTPQVDASAIV